MGFLNKIWDETLAGPAPENGLGMLRKYDWFQSPPPLAVTRSITVLKGNRGAGDLRKLNSDSGLIPDSPVGSSNPGTPLTPGTPGGVFGRFAGGKGLSTADDEPVSTTLAAIVINAVLDR